MSAFLLLLAAVAAVAATRSPLHLETPETKLQCFHPGDQADMQWAVFGAPWIRCISGLEPSRTYEIKISIPASTPARLRLAMKQSWRNPLPLDDAARAVTATSEDRSLEEAVFAFDEKITFRTDAFGRIAPRGAAEPLSPSPSATEHAGALIAFELLADPQSVAHSAVRQGVHFNLVVDWVAFGLIPHRAFHLAPALVITIAAIATLTVWLNRKLAHIFPMVDERLSQAVALSSDRPKAE